MIKYKVIIVLYLLLSVCTYAEALSDERTTTDISDEDIFISKFNLINHYNDSINNSAIDKVEDLLKATIKRTTNKFVAKKS